MRRWTQAERDFLRENWGEKGVRTLSRLMGRSESAILYKKWQMGLGPVLESGDYVSFSKLFRACGLRKSYRQVYRTWVVERGLPIHTRERQAKQWRVVYLDEFWAWAERHRGYIDFALFEENSLGLEPDWVKRQRAHDLENRGQPKRYAPWTLEEDAILKAMLSEMRWTAMQIGQRIGRSECAVDRRCATLGLRLRPLRVGTHETRWTEEDYSRLCDGLRDGMGCGAIARRIGKTENAVRGVLWRKYGTENADRVRAMMGQGPFGTGAPDMSIHRLIVMNPCSRPVREAVGKLAAVLAAIAERKKEEENGITGDD